MRRCARPVWWPLVTVTTVTRTQGRFVNTAHPVSDVRTLLADVLVVGGGGAGLATAAEATQRGLSVILVEKCEDLGGTTSRAVGSVSASGTEFQRRAGVKDSPDAHFADLAVLAGENAERDNEELRRLYVDNAGPTFEWLTSLGVSFFGPMPEPPNTHPRMHNVLPHSGAYIHFLKKAVNAGDSQILTGTQVEELVVEKGRVVGATCSTGGGTVVIRARATVLATGDFSADRALKAAHMGEPVSRVAGVNPHSTGDGQRLGLDAGGSLLNADLTLWGPEMRFVVPEKELLLRRLPPVKALATVMQQAIRFLPDRFLRPFIMAFATSYLAPSPKLFNEGAVLLNVNGERFTDERATPWLDLPEQPYGSGFIVLNGATARRFESWPYYVSTAPGVAYAYLKDYRRNRRDIVTEAETLPELARKLRMPPEVVAFSVPPGEGPWIALGPVKSWIVMTDGGLRVDNSLRVLRSDGDPIPGLLAAGSAGQGGLILNGHGNHLGWAFVSGRIAAQSAAAIVPVSTRA